MTIKIGTRNSPLALWQAEQIFNKLKKNHNIEILPIISQGDKNLLQPIYKMGISGVWTKDLDTALLNNKIDIAVHSLKDIPTDLPKGLIISCVLERDYPEDVLIRNINSTKTDFENILIGSSSLRRQAFWKNKYPKVNFKNIRGNIQTRLNKMNEFGYDGIILSLAGVKRMGWDIEYEILDFIIPSAGQGVIATITREDDFEINEILKNISDIKTKKCIEIERNILNLLEGGCSAPIGVNCSIINNEIKLNIALISIDGKERISFNKVFKSFEDIDESSIVNNIKENGGKEIMNKFLKKS